MLKYNILNDKINKWTMNNRGLTSTGAAIAEQLFEQSLDVYNQVVGTKYEDNYYETMAYNIAIIEQPNEVYKTSILTKMYINDNKYKKKGV